MSIVDEMRRAFDESFSKPDPIRTERPVRLIAVRAQDVLLAIRSDQIQQILRCPPLTPLPGAPSSLIGIGGVRATVVGFHSLRALAAGSGAISGTWAILCGRTRTIGLVFDDIVASVDRSIDELKGAIEIGGSSYLLIDLARIIEEIEPQGEK
jgi:chemotaxis signal transduction protein